jgi:hypothetical protein
MAFVGAAGLGACADGAALTVPFTAVGATGYGVARVTLTAGQAGAHVLASDSPSESRCWDTASPRATNTPAA